MARRRKKSGRKHERPLSSYERRPGSREPRPCLLVVCEGSQTEPNYFRSLCAALRLASVEVVVVGLGQAPINVVERATRQRAERAADGQRLPFDEAWCVFDQEVPPHSSFERAVAQANSSGLQLAVSTPTFEYWYLLHFEETDRPFGSADAVTAALRKHVPGYAKGKDVFPLLAPHVGAAIERAQRVWERHAERRGDGFPDPSTVVFVLVRRLRAMA